MISLLSLNVPKKREQNKIWELPNQRRKPGARGKPRALKYAYLLWSGETASPYYERQQPTNLEIPYAKNDVFVEYPNRSGS